HDKTVTSAAQNTDGTWTIVYDIEVENTGTVSGYYSLADTLEIDVPGVLSVVSASATGPSPEVGTWNGVGNTTLATDRLLATDGVEHYTITVVAAVTQGGFDNDASRCEINGGTNGFLNTSALTVAGVTTNDEACASPSAPTIVKD